MSFVWNFFGTLFSFVAMICFAVSAALLLRVISATSLPPTIIPDVAQLSLALNTPIEQILSQAMAIMGVIMALFAMVIYVGLLMGSRHAETQKALAAIAKSTRSNF